MPNGSLKILFLSNGLFVFASSLIGPLYAIFVQQFDAKVVAISASWAVFFLSSTLFTLATSRISDRFPKDDLLLAGYLVRALSWLIFLFVGNLPALIFVQILLGLGDALGSPAFNAIFAEHLDKNHHLSDYADWKFLENILAAVSITIGGFIVAKLGFQFLFLTMSILALVASEFILFHPKRIHLS